jgi:hypothetical protein
MAINCACTGASAAAAFTSVTNGSAANRTQHDSITRKSVVVRPSRTDGSENGVKSLEFDPCVGSGELPINLAFQVIAVTLPSSHFRGQPGAIGNPSVQALAAEDSQFCLRHVEPTAVLGGVMDLAGEAAWCLTHRLRNPGQFRPAGRQGAYRNRAGDALEARAEVLVGRIRVPIVAALSRPRKAVTAARRSPAPRRWRPRAA